MFSLSIDSILINFDFRLEPQPIALVDCSINICFVILFDGFNNGVSDESLICGNADDNSVFDADDPVDESQFLKQNKKLRLYGLVVNDNYPNRVIDDLDDSGLYVDKDALYAVNPVAADNGDGIPDGVVEGHNSFEDTNHAGTFNDDDIASIIHEDSYSHAIVDADNPSHSDGDDTIEITADGDSNTIYNTDPVGDAFLHGLKKFLVGIKDCNPWWLIDV